MKCTEPPVPRRKEGVVTSNELGEYDEIIDARSPAEFAEDHLPGAINLPVLDNEERARIGTLHKQVSAFEAKKQGAALVSRNIAGHLEAYFADKPRGYRPLVYCWRGGSRSGAFTTILRAVGWSAAQLEGGYKAFRRHVIEQLEALPRQFRFRVVCGPTGVGKSRFLRALEPHGAQVLDLEELAAHMGSVLGAYPDRPQPTQKYFETLIWNALRAFDPARPVFVESESKKIGKLHTPEVLLQAMRASSCINLTADIPVRVALLKDEYAHFLADPETLGRQLECLTPLQGKECIDQWKAQGERGQWDELVADLLVRHYDPAYSRSLGKNYVQAPQSPAYSLRDHSAEAFQELARQVLASVS
ncbi:MAG: tRNA 2-selenouridine(34) synthase MnmH [Thiobacillus sp.]|nr:tRNA 2-selenouridine(34) synthase MnmH [Thiobacillus sp.]